MILTGDIDTNKLVSLNGLIQASGHFMDPLNPRAGIQGLGDPAIRPLTTGLHGLTLGSLGCGNSVMDCSCKCSPAQGDQGIADAIGLVSGLSGLGDGAGLFSSLDPTTWGVTEYVLAGLAVYALFGIGGSARRTVGRIGRKRRKSSKEAKARKKAELQSQMAAI